MLDVIDNDKFLELSFNAPAYAPNAIPLETFRRTSNYTVTKFMDELHAYSLSYGMLSIIHAKVMVNVNGCIKIDELRISGNLRDYFYNELCTISKVEWTPNAKVLKVYIKLLKPLFINIPVQNKSKPKRKYRKRTGVPRGIRNEVFKRDNFTCVQCGAEKGDIKPDGTKVKLTVDHKKPLAKGGTDEMSNLQTLCWDCNANKNDVYQRVKEE